jgi:hypothetical protein
MIPSITSIPFVISGPIVRHVDTDTLTLWMTTKESISIEADLSKVKVSLYDHKQNSLSLGPDAIEIIEYRVGQRCFVSTLIIKQDDLFSDQNVYYYDIAIKQGKKTEQNDPSNYQYIHLSALLPSLLYPEQKLFSFKFSQRLTRVLHGSCRKAHYVGKDALPQLDTQLYNSIKNDDESIRPDLVLFTGDQVYIDDVAGPMLHAIHQVISLLGLYHEEFEGSTISHSQALFDHKDSLYHRDKLLPKTKANEELSNSFFEGKRKPIFTSVNAKNHLIALNEMTALYLLTWSSRLWAAINLEKTIANEKFQQQYDSERTSIENFQVGLPAVERSLAHIPVYMIFDDHDVTDDWNLTRAWEKDVYENPFSKRIVGNAIIAYLIFQGMGNPRTTWDTLLRPAKLFFTDHGFCHRAKFIDTLLAHHHWQYSLNTQPPVQVLDTRTQRWRSESNMNKPSGLMDWESLCALQHDIIGQPSVIMVSAAPVYGVKFIEAIQGLFTSFGGSLMVDAENWMAHKGTASVMLNIFRHVKTPPIFIILSGDVHYSFVYDVSLRFRRNSPKIVQFTCSGIHNQFPNTLIKWFERLNRWFYGHRSPLNWLTKRRNMSVKERKAEFHSPQRATHTLGNDKDIVNGTSLGLLELHNNGMEKSCKLILADGSMVNFIPDK